MRQKGMRGFASMDPKRQREIASMGGKAAHKSGKAYEWNPEQAKAAGRKGGLKKQSNLEQTKNETV